MGSNHAPVFMPRSQAKAVCERDPQSALFRPVLRDAQGENIVESATAEIDGQPVNGYQADCSKLALVVDPVQEGAPKPSRRNGAEPGPQ